MAAGDRSVDIVAFLAEHLRDILRRRLREATGLALMSLALLGAIALATWSVQDPSLSHATHKPIHNLLGYPGAIFSDLAMQLLGLASVVLLAPEALIGARLFSHRPVGEGWRLLLWLVAMLLAAGFVSTLPTIGSWPLPTGMGGVFGDALLRVPAIIAGGTLKGFTAAIASVGFGFATLIVLAFAAMPAGTADEDAKPVRARRKAVKEEPEEEPEEDESEEEEDEPDRASPWLGMLVHALLSWKAWLVRLLRSKPRTAAPAATAARQEPRFDRLGRVAAPGVAPQADADADE